MRITLKKEEVAAFATVLEGVTFNGSFARRVSSYLRGVLKEGDCEVDRWPMLWLLGVLEQSQLTTAGVELSARLEAAANATPPRKKGR